MALFVGGPADGWRLGVDSHVNEVRVALDPVEVTSKNIETFAYKRECIVVGDEEYCIFIPRDWTADQLVQALILYYRKDNEETRLTYLNNTKGVTND